MTTSLTVETALFTCSICGERSRDICVCCTKDACSNHRCERCKRCSDCCECEVPLSAAEVQPAEESHAAPEPASGDGQGPSAADSATEAATVSEPSSTVEPLAMEPLPEPETSESSAPPDEIG